MRTNVRRDSHTTVLVGHSPRFCESFSRTFRTVTRARPLTKELDMLHALLTISAGLLGYFLARNFVRRRLRFVDAVQSPLAPILSGVAATLLAWPAVLLPFVTLITAIMFGIGTGFGTASGVRALKRNDNLRRLAP
jgi:CHASE2 domain-containing sensor protein